MSPSPLPQPPPPDPAQESNLGLQNASTGHSTERPSLLDLVLAGIASPETRRHYARSLLEFAQWRVAEGRGFDQASIAEWRNHLTGKGLSPSTVNQKLAAVKKLAAEAAAAGLIPEARAAGIRAARGVRQLGDRAGNWLTREQAQKLIEAPMPGTLKGKRDRAALALLVGCGLRRNECTRIAFEDIQQREGRWVIPDLRGKHGRIRTVPVPAWVKVAVDEWQSAAQLATGRILRGMNRHDQITHDSLSDQAVFNLAAQYGRSIGVEIAAHDLRRTCAKLCRKGGGELEQIQLLLGHASIQTTERYLGTRQDLTNAPNDRLGLKWRNDE